MSAYLVANFELTNAEGYKAYVPAVIPTLQAHGAEILVADYESEPLEGAPGAITVVIRFESKEALHTWYRSPEYQEIIGLRTDNSTGIAVIVEDLDMQKNMRLLAAM
jgi:uncharacterized protein (DUF1330 family)